MSEALFAVIVMAGFFLLIGFALYLDYKDRSKYLGLLEALANMEEELEKERKSRKQAQIELQDCIEKRNRMGLEFSRRLCEERRKRESENK
ncbi:hypothetical protein [Bergeriella denitrificans]|uniref:Uncharacterized protein n=1 Tax=Bergeriella denitrificans TaxID=494 RepID=A0A378UJA1_BERDE|nr:hypothetical protein [Bergeriella denitrificans]STZ77365.1 Uncharacterised protein [Bergeriella denitrificans]